MLSQCRDLEAEPRSKKKKKLMGNISYIHKLLVTLSCIMTFFGNPIVPHRHQALGMNSHVQI